MQWRSLLFTLKRIWQFYTLLAVVRTIKVRRIQTTSWSRRASSKKQFGTSSSHSTVSIKSCRLPSARYSSTWSNHIHLYRGRCTFSNKIVRSFACLHSYTVWYLRLLALHRHFRPGTVFTIFDLWTFFIKCFVNASSVHFALSLSLSLCNCRV
jgi:hypothetical protein